MIVYLHGFSSAATSNKANTLKQALKPIPFFIADYPSHQPHAAIQTIESYIDQLRAQQHLSCVMLIGSSLGGYYAQYLGATLESVRKVVLINPSLQPRNTLRSYIGPNLNSVTGKPFVFTEQDFSELVHYDLAPSQLCASTLVLLDKTDELIDYRVAAKRYAAIGRVVIYPGGSHQFEHLDQAVEAISEYYSATVPRRHNHK
jgi:predicted esterase YcpF (UPF0227 family)